jgi:hypothetical protein
MSEEKPINADDLTKTKKGDVQLSEEDLSKASGGFGCGGGAGKVDKDSD